MSDLHALLEKIEAAEGPSRELDAEIMVAIGGATRIDECTFYGPGAATWYFGENEEEASSPPLPHLTASLDASLSLVEKLLPGAEYELTTLYGGAKARLPLNFTDQPYEFAHRDDGDMPLAILSALIRALIAKEEAANV